MPPEALLIALIAVPVVVLVVLRVNAALVFLSLCLGNVLASFTAKDTISIVSGASTSVHASDTVIRLGLLLAPAVLTALFMIKTVKKSKQVFNALPAIGTGLLAALLVVPQLPSGTAHTVMRASLWANISQLASAIVAASAFVCLIFLWMQRPKNHNPEEAGKKHKG